MKDKKNIMIDIERNKTIFAYYSSNWFQAKKKGY
jgi:hypothetical protein